MRKICFLLLVMCLTTNTAMAQGNIKSITLTETANGTNKEEATDNALRKAIGQIQSVISSISNVNGYNCLFMTDSPKGGKEVTLQATFEIPTSTMAPASGTSVEFQGSAFTRDIKLRELKKKNELQALYVLKDQIQYFLPLCLKRQISVSEPQITREDYNDHIFGYQYNYGLARF